MRYFLISISIGILFLGCNSRSALEKEIAEIPVEFIIERFDQEFAQVTPQRLSTLKETYPFLFPKQYADSLWLRKAQDTIQQELTLEVSKVFPNVDAERIQLRGILQHIRYYFPEVKVPRVITITSDVDYQNKIVLADGLLLIALDTYLGTEHHFYEAIQVYLKKHFVRDRIPADIALAYAKKLVPLPKKRTFLDNLIFHGKVLYVQEKLLPEAAQALRMGYTKAEYDWATANEEQIWRYFIDKDLLYSTDQNLHPRFLYPAPFSKFYLEEIDQEAPDRIGQYIGWKIISSYMEHHQVTLRELLATDSETLFRQSKYKPSK